MGSSYFYLEFLMAWVDLLKDSGYKNPAIFALEYDLVPDAQFPTQLEQAMTGYDYVCSITQDSSVSTSAFSTTFVPFAPCPEMLFEQSTIEQHFTCRWILSLLYTDPQSAYLCEW